VARPSVPESVSLCCATTSDELEAPSGTRLEGSVERVTFYNPENGFSVLRVRVRGHREPVVVVGTLPAVQPGERLVLRERWQTDPQHGAQFRPGDNQVSSGVS